MKVRLIYIDTNHNYLYMFCIQRISEKKLEAFTVGTFSKRQLVSFCTTLLWFVLPDTFIKILFKSVNLFIQSKKELEEQKKKADEAAAAHVS